MKQGLVCALLALSLLAGCAKQAEYGEYTLFALDTVVQFTLSGGEEARAADRDILTNRLYDYEAMLSATRAGSDIFRVNQASGQPVEVDPAAARLLSQALELCRVTGGALDITAYPAVKAWGFTEEEHRVPSPAELEELAAKIDYTAVELEGNTITLPAGMEMDLGAVAKGYIGDMLAEQGLASALLDLGQSTILAVGSKPGQTPWRIGIQDPAGEGYFAVVELTGLAMGTSGGYQRYFEEDGEVYWHILDPETAAPARSGLASVTVVSPSALVCDGLSTALFVMGLEEGARFWRDHPELEFEAVFVTQEGEIYRTAGLEGRFSLAEGHRNREVKVLE